MDDLSTADARRIAADWHGGQWSALYALASTGSIGARPADRVRLLREIADARAVSTPRFHAELDDLARWVSTREEALRDA